MTLKWGFGIEKETGIVGYNDNLKDFTDISKGNAGRYGHGDDRLTPMGDFANKGTDITVFATHGGAGYEWDTRDTRIRKDPKETIVGFIKDTERFARSELSSPRKNARTIPFGSSPLRKMSDYRSNVPGSYHFNLTMPYDPDMSQAERKKYKEKLFKGMLNVRAIQPLILAMTGGTTVDAVGNPKYLEGSVRQVYAGRTSGIGSTDLGPNSEIKEVILNTDDYVKLAIDRNGRDRDHPSRADHPHITEKSSPGDTWRSGVSNYPGVGNSSYTDMLLKGYEKEVPTVEYRFLDTFDTRGTYALLAVMSSALANGHRIDYYDDPRQQGVWKRAMIKVVEEGWNAYLDIDYAKYLEEKLKIKLDIENTHRIRADVLTERVVKALWEQNKDDVWVKGWITDRKPPKLHNFSRDSWEFYFLNEIKNKPTLAGKVQKLLQTIGKIDASQSSGKIRVMWDKNKRGYAVRDLILDEQIMGWEFGYEDVEDILHFLKRYNFIQLSLKEDGSIYAIKKSWNNDEELETLWNTMLQEKNILNEAEGGLLEVEIPTGPAPTPPVETPRAPPPTPRTPPPATLGSVGEDTVGRIRVNIVRYPSDSDETYALEDLDQIFSQAEFTNSEGRRYAISLKYATFSPSQFANHQAIWKKTSPSRVIIYINNELAPLAPTQAISRMRTSFFHEDDTTRVSVFALTTTEFFDKLMRIATEEYSKSGRIQLDRAGIQRLKDMGIHIGSIGNGARYVLLTKERKKKLLHYKPRVLKNIPYQKSYYVETTGNAVKLLRDGKIMDEIRR